MLETITKAQLSQWHSEGRTHRVLAILLQATQQLDDTEFTEGVLLQSAQISDWQKIQASGTLSRDELTAQRNRINAGLLYWMGELPENTPLSISSEILKKADEEDRAFVLKSYRNWVLIGGGIALVAVLLFFLLKNTGGGNFIQTIFIKDEKVGQNLANKGFIILESKFGLDSVRIGDNGEALFNLQSNLIGDTVKMRIRHELPYQVENVNAIYILERNKPISLVVALGNLDKLEGEIIDAATEKPLDSVRVSIKNIETFTNKNGWFKLEIPSSERAAIHRVAIDKDHYQRLVFDSVPIVLGQQLRFSMTRMKSN